MTHCGLLQPDPFCDSVQKMTNTIDKLSAATLNNLKHVHKLQDLSLHIYKIMIKKLIIQGKNVVLWGTRQALAGGWLF